ncbi:chaperonin Cpn60/TCP-1 family [Pelagophyceae sp. CCMP2097]|nr:chaperonin Cpn60/TCP-1 family [Pelagophyceae sp. CCMP2097]
MSTFRNMISGERTSGADVRAENVTACMAISNIVKSSLGPVGLDKMLVDEIGDVVITNDGATILSRLEVEHPAAKVLVELAELQDSEVGDGTTSVVIIAAELLKRGNELIKIGIHPTTIMSGYRMALKEAVKYIKASLMVPIASLGDSCLENSARTSMASKILNSDADFWSKLAVDAVKSIKTETADGKPRYPVSAIHILKAHGKSSTESELVADGFALNVARAAQGMTKVVVGAKIALLDFPLQRHKVQMGVQIQVENPDEVEGIKQRELDITKERIQKILASGANVILTTKGIDDTCLKYFVEAGAIAARRVKKEDMTRLARATGATIVVTLADMEGNETFDAGCLGEASSVSEERVGDGEMLYVRGTKKARATTVVLRGANEVHLDELDRALHDVLMVVKRVLESSAVVAGGGAVEAALSIHLEAYSRGVTTREQLAIAEFADALLVIPRTLSVNAAQDAIELVSTLRAAHHASQHAGQPELKHTGLDLVKGVTRDNLARGVLEPAISKIKSLRFATEAAITILRIDDMIKLDPKQQQQR